jgi:hypothetical protein
MEKNQNNIYGSLGFINNNKKEHENELKININDFQIIHEEIDNDIQNKKKVDKENDDDIQNKENDDDIQNKKKVDKENDDDIQNKKKVDKENQENDDLNDSCALDIIAVYLKGQKIIYMESKIYCQQILNILMLPAIFISALTSVLSFSIESYSFGTILVSSLNGFNTFILSLVSYLKLDAKSEAHRMSSYKFDDLQSQCEFKSGQILLFDIDDKKKVLNKFLETIEKEVIEIKSTNQFIIPDKIRNKYIYTYSTNVFALVKELISDQQILKKKLDLVNEKIKIYNKNLIKKEKYQELLIKLNTEHQKILSFNNSEIVNSEQKKLYYFKTIENINEKKIFINDKIKNININNDELISFKIDQDYLINQCLLHRKKYMEIDKFFKNEIQKNSKNNFNLFNWLKT